MGTKNNPGKFDCYAKAEPDEPMFILLARDPSAPWLIEKWCDERATQIGAGDRPESDREKIAEAIECAREMRRWRREHR
jgi:hypothetical protein